MQNPYPPTETTRPIAAEPAPRRSRIRRAALPLAAAIVGGAVALGGAAVTGNLGGGDTTIIREPSAQQAALPADDGERPEETAAASEAPAGATEALSVQEIVRRTSPAVVEVTVGGRIDPLQGRVLNQRALGSGFVIDDSGHILTNQHVVAGFDTAAVTFEDGSVLEAEVLGQDDSTDVAVLRVEALPPGVTPVSLGSSADLHTGDGVVALGNPLGQDRTATTGIVSALERNLDAPDGETVIQNAIQTDAAINQGNSGGPLFDLAARVIGINSQIATRGGGSDGIGFAVPIDTVRPVAQSIIETGEPQHAWMGISGLPLNPALAEALDLGDQRGVILNRVGPDSPAGRAGLVQAPDPGESEREGGDIVRAVRGADIMVEVDGTEIEDMADVSRAVSSRRVGDEISVTVLREGEREQITFALGDRPDDIDLGQP